MAGILTDHGAHFLRIYSSVNCANGALIIDDGTGRPLRSKNGRLEVGDNRNRLLTKTGHPVRLQQSVKLCDATAEFTSANSPDVLRLMADKLDEIKKWEDAADSDDVRPDGSMLVRDFFLNVFLPYIKNNNSPSTYESHKSYWTAYLAPHFNHTRTLKGYEPRHGTDFLEGLASRFSKNTVKNCRAVASRIFGYATAKGYITVNPWSDVETGRCQAVEETVAYTVQDIERILAALETVTGREAYSARLAEMVVSVCFWGGLRPSEAAGLRWENVHFDCDEPTIYVTEVFVTGAYKSTTKTGKDGKNDPRTVPMLAQLRNRLKLWHAERLHPREGLVFPNQSGSAPVNINDISSRILGPTLKKHGLDWRGLYACRRGFGTLLVNAGATLEETSVAMGNSPQVVFAHYFKKRDSKLAHSGVAKLQQALDTSDKSKRLVGAL